MAKMEFPRISKLRSGRLFLKFAIDEKSISISSGLEIMPIIGWFLGRFFLIPNSNPAVIDNHDALLILELFFRFPLFAFCFSQEHWHELAIMCNSPFC